MSTLYKVLYTHQKAKKKKTWQDGYLKVFCSNKKGVLLTEDSKSIDSLFVRTPQLDNDTELESDKYLITVEHVHVNQNEEKENISTKTLLRVPQDRAKPIISRNLNNPFRPVFSKHGTKPQILNKTSQNSCQNLSMSPGKSSVVYPVTKSPLCLQNTVEDKKLTRSLFHSPINISPDDLLIESVDNVRNSSGFRKEKQERKHCYEVKNNIYFKEDRVSTSYQNYNSILSAEFSNPVSITPQIVQTYNNNALHPQDTADLVSTTEKRNVHDILALFSDHTTSNSEIQTMTPSESKTYVKLDIPIKIRNKCDFVEQHIDNKTEFGNFWSDDDDSNDVIGDEMNDVFSDHMSDVISGDCDELKFKDLKRKSDSVSHESKKICLSTNSLSIDNVIEHSSTGKTIDYTKSVNNTQLKGSVSNVPSHQRNSHHNASGTIKPNEPRCNMLSGRSSFVAPVSYKAEFTFPSKDYCTSTPVPKREIKIPFKFDSVMSYKQTFKSVLKEHLNIVLFEVATRYHTSLNSVDVKALDTSRGEQAMPNNVPKCKHGPCTMKAVRKEGKNNGRLFYTCSMSGKEQCNLFVWADQMNKSSVQTKNGTSNNGKRILNDTQSLSTYLNSRGIQLYCGVKIARKAQFFNFKNAGTKTKTSFRGGESSRKKALYLVLPFKKASSNYSKEDIWLISHSLDFHPSKTFVAKSVFYGPNSSGELEISPLAAYSISNWQNDDVCFAIQACNASTELTCIENLNDYVNPLDLLVLPHLLSASVLPSGLQSIYNRFNLSCLVYEDITELIDNVISTFVLNEDQILALKEIARMFLKDHNKFVTLIHGVFGAGKSYLLATVVLFLVQLFELIEVRFKLKTKLKILISSTTNVAVDRVLQGLLDLGFQEFVRVGSVKKIAKVILPYSVHASDNEDQELKELNEMNTAELTVEEKGYIKKAIEHHRQGVNRQKLNDVTVVGVTCAACVFPYLQNLTFQVQLLDECSQMIEPLSMLPIARFKCERLVLVGDPKQLSPTIQGSEASHDRSLEMTLFERLQHMEYEPIILRTQYRCHPAISEVCSQMFYDGVLRNGVTEEQRLPIVDWLPTLSFCDVSNGLEECQSDGSYSNAKEADFISELLLHIIQSGAEPVQVGVITQYKSQVRKISTLLSASNMSSAELKAIQISTVDAFQGAEKEIILLSCVRTKNIGFIDNPRRTNVALSRAKRHLVIVGNHKLLSTNRCWLRVLNVCKTKDAVIEKAESFLNRVDNLNIDEGRNE